MFRMPVWNEGSRVYLDVHARSSPRCDGLQRRLRAAMGNRGGMSHANT